MSHLVARSERVSDGASRLCSFTLAPSA